MRILIDNDRLINLEKVLDIVKFTKMNVSYNMIDSVFRFSYGIETKTYSFDKLYCLVSTYGYQSAIKIIEEEIFKLWLQ